MKNVTFYQDTQDGSVVAILHGGSRVGTGSSPLEAYQRMIPSPLSHETDWEVLRWYADSGQSPEDFDCLGHVSEVLVCQCACGCNDFASTTDEGTLYCPACAEYTTDENGTPVCSKRSVAD